MIFRRATLLLMLSCLALTVCSCQSPGSMPRDPFASSPDITIAPYPVPEPAPVKRAESAGPETLFLRQDYKSGCDTTLELESESDRTRLVLKESNSPIRQVSFVEETAPASGGGTDPKKPRADALTIDPALAEEGARIVAEHREGRETFQGSWRPQGVAGFWPQIEYLADGGDDGYQVYVEDDWTVRNLQVEDTVAHFDTLDGRTIVEPSNRVHLYAPRFGAVRKIEGVLNSGQITALSGANNQLALNVDRNREQLGYTAQESTAGYARTRSQLGGVGTRQAGAGAETTQGLGSFGNFEAVMYYSNWLRQRSVGSAELVHLARGGESARAWQGQEGTRVRINTLAPMAASSEEGAESFFTIEEDESKTSKLRLIKVASKKSAQPGEIIEFTLRFDNIGNQPIGNVTVLDSLTTRLEFLPGSAKCSVKSGFVLEPNEGASFTLRFEITEPLEPGQFGVVQFQCRVR